MTSFVGVSRGSRKSLFSLLTTTWMNQSFLFLSGTFLDTLYVQNDAFAKIMISYVQMNDCSTPWNNQYQTNEMTIIDMKNNFHTRSAYTPMSSWTISWSLAFGSWKKMVVSVDAGMGKVMGDIGLREGKTMSIETAHCVGKTFPSQWWKENRWWYWVKYPKTPLPTSSGSSLQQGKASTESSWSRFFINLGNHNKTKDTSTEVVVNWEMMMLVSKKLLTTMVKMFFFYICLPNHDDDDDDSGDVGVVKMLIFLISASASL